MPRRRTSPFFIFAIVAAFLMSEVGVLWACNYRAKMRAYNRIAAQYVAGPNPTLLGRLCRKRAQIECKFKGAPGKPTPPLPAGAACAPKGNGGGRGGGQQKGGACPPGGMHEMAGWIRNHMEADCEFDWEVIPDPANPPVFTLLTPPSGSLFVPAFEGLTFPIEVLIDPSATIGTSLFFDIEIKDCAGLELADEFGRVEIEIVELGLQAVEPLVVAPSSGPFDIAYAVTNPTGSEITLPYTFGSLPDPASQAATNGGVPYDIPNILGGGGGGSVTIGPGETEIILWDQLIPGEYCDPEMIGCCIIEIGGASCCVMVGNDLSPAVQFEFPSVNLVGVPAGGQIDVFFQWGPDNFLIQQPTPPGSQIPQILDQVTFQMLNQLQSQPGFHFVPMVDQLGISVMSPQGSFFEPQSFDPGLSFVQMDPFPTIGQPELAQPHEQFLVLWRDGQVLPNQPVDVFVSGANNFQQTIVTDNTGVAQFSYFGTQPGEDMIEFVAEIPNPPAPGVPGGTFTQTAVSWVIWVDDVADVEPSDFPSESTVLMHTARPNPFGNATTIEFQLAESTPVDLVVYAADGRRITTLIEDQVSAGVHTVDWNGTTDEGLLVPAGVYFYELTTSSQVVRDRVTLIK